jgi:hypothetical protein
MVYRPDLIAVRASSGFKPVKQQRQQRTAPSCSASAETGKRAAFDQTQAELLPQTVSAEVRLVKRRKKYLRSRLD